MGSMKVCPECEGRQIGMDEHNFSMTGKCETCKGVGWVDEGNKIVEERESESSDRTRPR